MHAWDYVDIRIRRVLRDLNHRFAFIDFGGDKVNCMQKSSDSIRTALTATSISQMYMNGWPKLTCMMLFRSTLKCFGFICTV